MQLHTSVMQSESSQGSSVPGDYSQDKFAHHQRAGAAFMGGAGAQRRDNFNAYQGVDGHRPIDPQLILQQKADVENVSFSNL